MPRPRQPAPRCWRPLFAPASMNGCSGTVPTSAAAGRNLVEGGVDEARGRDVTHGSMRGMYAMAEETRLPADIDAQPVVQAAAALQPELRSYREEIEREQHLPKALVEQLRAAGFYRMVIQ